MKSVSILYTLLVAFLVASGSDAAKCNVKTPSPAPAPMATKAPAPMATKPPAPMATKAPTAPMASKTPAAAPIVAPAKNSTTPAKPTTAPSPAAGDSDTKAKKSAGCGKPAAIKTGSFKTTINGKQRQYMVRVPENYSADKAYRVVFTLHWRGSGMVDAAKLSGGYYGLQALAKESTIFVSPEGLEQGWFNHGGEDISLVKYIVKTLDDGLCVDQTQRFATGFSFGGAMSHSIACSLPDSFRAVSIFSGGQFSGCDGGTKPIAYMITHGVADTNVVISNGHDLRDRFVKVNGCTPQNAPEPKAGSGTHIKTEYKGCSAGHPVVYIAHDGGHTAEPADKDRVNWAPKETWGFFTQFA